MKNLLIALICVIHVAKTYGQSDVRRQIVVEITKEKRPKKIYARVELKSSPISGDSALVQYLEKNINGSIQHLIRRVTTGKYIIRASFFVDKKGNTTDFYVEDNPGFGLKEEVIRTFKKGTAWRYGGEVMPAHH